ncbi:MAG: magnesium/cobalt transporter CorA [Bacteroidales bacterium]|nr:magnesium/cobalt transporter CorA [Bacteroidales bacterium]
MKLPKSNLLSIMKRKAGKAPGELLPAGDSAHPTKISVITYNDKNYRNVEVADPNEIPPLLSDDTTNWIHISGFDQVETFRQFGEIFHINMLAIEDALNPEHLPKAEELDDQLFVTVKSLTHISKEDEYSTNHLSFVLSPKLIVSISQYHTSIFDDFISRIDRAVGKIRSRKEDYILYRLIDIVTDNYFLVFEDLEEELFVMEEQLVVDSLADAATKIIRAKKDIFYLKKYLQPSSEAVYNILKLETNLIKKQNRGFYTDVLDHLKHLLQNLEGYRETTTGLMELNMANNANRGNEVMKTLTIIATIFIPLTFFAGIYGMNFEYMPELTVKWAYPTLLLFMLVLGLGMYFYMKKKNWF